MKTTQSAEYFERAKKWTPGGVHSPVRAFRGVGGVPRFIDSARGAEIRDVDGNTYDDYCMSWGPLMLGHRDEEVLAAVQDALGRGWTFGAAETVSLELAELMTEKLSWVDQVRFVNSGTEAVMSALRLARGVTGRNKVIKFDGCYHGHVDSMLVRAGSGLAEMASPDSAGVSENVASDTIVCPLDDLDAYRKIFTEKGSEIAAVIVEPVPANNGLLVQRDGFLKEIAATARRNGALVIFDEVITGFRVAFGGMAELSGVEPDLVTYGKVIGGGFPVGAYAGRAEYMNYVAPVGPVYQAGTLSANPVAMAAGLATLKKLWNDKPFEILAERTQRIADGLRGFKGKVPVHVQNFGSLFWLVLGEVNTEDGKVRRADQIPASQGEVFAEGFHRLLERGIYLAPSGFEVGFLSTSHSDEQIDRLIHELKEVLAE